MIFFGIKQTNSSFCYDSFLNRKNVKFLELPRHEQKITLKGLFIFALLGINGVFAHNGRFASGSFKENDEIECEIDWELRYKIMKLHTTGHILDYALREVYGKAIDTLGALHGPPKAYTIYKANPPDQVMLNSIENIANEIVQEDKGVNIVYVDAAKLSEVAVNAPNLDRLPASDRYRIVVIDGVNGIPCAGTHVKKTGEVGHIKVLGTEAEQEGFKLYYDAES